MGVERWWHWVCDLCGLTHVLADLGVPPKWMIFARGGRTLHACGECSPTVPDAKPPSAFRGHYNNEWADP